MAKDTQPGKALGKTGATPPLKNGEIEFTLSSGKIARVRPGKGHDSVKAMRVSGSDGERYLAALIAQLTTIDGKQVNIDDVLDLGLKDYTLLQTHFSEINF